MKLGRLAGTAVVAMSLAISSCGGGGTGTTDIPPLELVTSALADAHVGDTVNIALEAKGGVEPYTFSATGLPDGLSVSGKTIAGTTNVPGRKQVALTVQDSNGTSVSKTLPLYVIPDALEILTTSLPGGKEGTAYDQSLLARGGVPPLVWSLADGTLPAGLTIESTGQIAGTPTAAGLFTFSVRVTDAEDTKRDAALMLTLGALNPMLTTLTVPSGRVGQMYEATLQAEGGELPYTFTSAGALPNGLTLNPDGTIEGVPTTGGNFMFSIAVNDSSTPPRMDMAQVSITVVGALAIQTTQIAQVLRGRAYAFSMQASGGVPPYVWSLGAGRPPLGINFDANGAFTGMSTEVGEQTLTIRVRDAEGFQESALFTIRVSDRFTYDALIPTPIAIPPICTSTHVSYVTVPIEVPESYQVGDVDITVDITYDWDDRDEERVEIREQRRTLGSPRIVLYSPNGNQAPLCGNGVAIPAGRVCTPPSAANTGDMVREWDDDGAQANRPERPLSVFDGINARGTWMLAVGIAEPTCTFQGTINRVQLSVQDDRNVDPYVIVRGYRKNNLVIEPYVRSCTPNCGSGLIENELFLDAHVFDVGMNGYPEGGLGDDNDLGIQFTWVWDGTALDGVTLDPDGHVLVGDSGQTGCNQGRCAGTGQRGIVGTGGGHNVNLTLRVLPPEWNPQVREY